MSKYKITEWKHIAYRNGKNTYKVTIVADTETDIPEPLDEWETGSMCMIADTHKYKILNNERKWA